MRNTTNQRTYRCVCLWYYQRRSLLCFSHLLWLHGETSRHNSTLSPYTQYTEHQHTVQHK